MEVEAARLGRVAVGALREVVPVLGGAGDVAELPASRAPRCQPGRPAAAHRVAEGLHRGLVRRDRAEVVGVRGGCSPAPPVGRRSPRTRAGAATSRVGEGVVADQDRGVEARGELVHRLRLGLGVGRGAAVRLRGHARARPRPAPVVAVVPVQVDARVRAQGARQHRVLGARGPAVLAPELVEAADDHRGAAGARAPMPREAMKPSGLTTGKMKTRTSSSSCVIAGVAAVEAVDEVDRELHRELARGPLAGVVQAELEVGRPPVILAVHLRGDLQAGDGPPLEALPDRQLADDVRVVVGELVHLVDVVLVDPVGAAAAGEGGAGSRSRPRPRGQRRSSPAGPRRGFATRTRRPSAASARRRSREPP